MTEVTTYLKNYFRMNVNMATILKRKEAVDFLKIDSKVFDNFFKNASEFDALPRDGGRGLFKFDQDSLQNWKNNYEWRTVELGLNDYKLCLDFALVGIGIKSSKPKSAYLILGEKEVTLPERQSDIYVYCRVDIPDDHLLRIARDDIISAVKGGPLYNNYKNEMPYFSDIKCEIAGWCTFDDLETVTSIPGQTFDSVRKVKQSGRLKRSKQDWEKLISLL
jgi:hypothetical protein